MALNCNQLTAIIGDDLIIRVTSKDGSVDFTPYTIASELRANGGDSAIAATFAIAKDAPNSFGKVPGFTATLSASVTASLTPRINYGIDYKLILGGAVQHSERLVMRFEKAVTV